MRRLAVLAVSALWAALLAGCPERREADAGVVDAGPAVVAEKEPNSSHAQAMALAASSAVNAAISLDPSGADEDWYLLTAGRPQVVDLSVTGLPAADVVLELYDQDQNALVAVNSEGVGKGERVPNLGVRDRLWVKVTSGKKGSGGAYTLTALFADPGAGYEVEPNDRAADATVLPLGQAVSGYLGHAADTDWFKIELPVEAPPAPPLPEVPGDGIPGAGAGAGAEDAGMQDAGAAPAESRSVALRIEVTGVPGVKLEVQVLSAAEAALFQIKGKDDEGLTLRNIGVREADQVLYVVVKSAWVGTAGKDLRRGYNPDHSYTLTVSQEEAGANAELEPNDVLDKATPLPAQGGGYREGFLSPKADVDYYVLKADQPVLASVQLSGVERVDLVMSVVVPPEAEGGKETVLLRANDGAIKEPEQLNNLSCPATCYLRVEGGLKKVEDKMVRDYENAELPYRLTVTVRPDVGSEEREPNGTVEGATPIALGKPMRGTVHPKKDVDYYRLDLSARPVRTALRMSVIGILKVDVGLYLHRVDEEGKLSLVQTADRAKGDKPELITYSAEPGVYVLEVRDSKNRESNFLDPYQVSVEEAN